LFNALYIHNFKIQTLTKLHFINDNPNSSLQFKTFYENQTTDIFAWF